MAELESTCSLLTEAALVSLCTHHTGGTSKLTTGDYALLRLALGKESKRGDFLQEKVAEKLVEFTELFLGDSYLDPGQEEFDDLTVALLYRYGYGPTALYYAYCLKEEGISAAGKIQACFGPGGILFRENALRPYVGSSRTVSAQRVATHPQTSREQEGISRSASRKEVKKHSGQRKKKASRTEHAVRPAERSSGAPEHAQGVNVVRLGYARPYGRLGFFAGMEHDTQLAGRVFIADVRFHYGPVGSKERPVVLLATRTTGRTTEALILPIYSQPNKPAGGWKATEVLDFKEAGLSYGGYAGVAAIAIELPPGQEFVGRVSENDWTRLCIGEVQ